MRGPSFPDALPCCDAMLFDNPPHVTVVYQLVCPHPPNNSPRTPCINSSTPHTAVYQIVNSTPALGTLIYTLRVAGDINLHLACSWGRHEEKIEVGHRTGLCRRIVDHLEVSTEVLNKQELKLLISTRKEK